MKGLQSTTLVLPLKLIRSNSVLESGNRTLEACSVHVTGYGTLPALLAVTGDLAHPDLVADNLHWLAALRFTPAKKQDCQKRRKNAEKNIRQMSAVTGPGLYIVRNKRLRLLVGENSPEIYSY